MGEQRQRFTQEFKEQTVKYIQEQTKSVADIAEELNIPKKTLHNWLTKYRKFENEPLTSVETLRQQEKRIKEQEQELADLKEEIAILKKAMHIFSKERN
ncbi:transposase [Gordoniibacillus kamchatkensis]|uniref:Transposase n=1 Tax=Gordoniibacillus kamchatkensis TaxID=1590651 RepID=A0ABR5A216_9BACL|nr:transposase [Paenibacillus sp. VKM B-2647]KIL34467.1 transposase [Paenibacillus sp. VKM B-2647]